MAGISRLDARFPAWDLLMLGGRPVSGNRAPRTGNGPVGVKGVHAAECVYQSHGYVVRATAFDSIKEKLAQGFVADNALVSYQGRFADPKAQPLARALVLRASRAAKPLLTSGATTRATPSRRPSPRKHCPRHRRRCRRQSRRRHCRRHQRRHRRSRRPQCRFLPRSWRPGNKGNKY